MERLIGMAGPGTIERPDLREEGLEQGVYGYIVTVYDNDFNTVDEVIEVLMAATGCSLQEAEMETWEVHYLGRSVVHHGPFKECQAAAEIIAQIGIRVEVSKE